MVHDTVEGQNKKQSAAIEWADKSSVRAQCLLVLAIVDFAWRVNHEFHAKFGQTLENLMLNDLSLVFHFELQIRLRSLCTPQDCRNETI